MVDRAEWPHRNIGRYSSRDMSTFRKEPEFKDRLSFREHEEQGNEGDSRYLERPLGSSPQTQLSDRKSSLESSSLLAYEDAHVLWLSGAEMVCVM